MRSSSLFSMKALSFRFTIDSSDDRLCITLGEKALALKNNDETSKDRFKSEVLGIVVLALGSEAA